MSINQCARWTRNRSKSINCCNVVDMLARLTLVLRTRLKYRLKFSFYFTPIQIAHLKKMVKIKMLTFSLGYVLGMFLKFVQFQPQHFYKKNGCYKKKRVYLE